MPPQKYLKDFLREEHLGEEQEPFHLPNPLTKKTKSHNPNPKTSSSSFYKYPCFSSITVSSTTSPLIRYSATSTSLSPLPRGGQNGGQFLHVPSKTAALLLEAAVRIQKQNSKSKSKNGRFGILGSVLRRLRGKNRSSQNRARIGGDGDAVGVDEIIELKIDEGDLGCSSPFRFALVRDDEESSDRPSPGFRSPATGSPCPRQQSEDHSSHGEDRMVRCEAQDEEDKEQNSPVSVLEPPFDDDEDGHEGEEENGTFEGTYGYDLESSYAFVQKTKKKLLHKLRRFEKLAELDPVELEKRIQEEEEADEDDSIELQEEGDIYEDKDEEDTEASLIKDVLCQSGYQGLELPGMKLLISHLIYEEDEEGRKHSDNSVEATMKRVCKRLESWRCVETNTIDLMIRMDLDRKTDDWKKFLDQINEVALAAEAELSVTLLAEVLEELIRS
ncbi:hypothetical protein AKJ16_DCAP21727 [Drosera capensis]